MDDDIKELVRNLTQPHRVPNPLAMYRMCEKAAQIIQDQAAELETLKAQPKAAPRKSAKKAD